MLGDLRLTEHHRPSPGEAQRRPVDCHGLPPGHAERRRPLRGWLLAIGHPGQRHSGGALRESTAAPRGRADPRGGHPVRRAKDQVGRRREARGPGSRGCACACACACAYACACACACSPASADATPDVLRRGFARQREVCGLPRETRVRTPTRSNGPTEYPAGHPTDVLRRRLARQRKVCGLPREARMRAPTRPSGPAYPTRHPAGQPTELVSTDLSRGQPERPGPLPAVPL